MFPAQNVTVKHHLLEDHAVQQLTKFKVGFGLLNKVREVHSMHNDLQKLMSIRKRYHLSTAPEIQANVIMPWIKHESKI